MSQQMQTDPQLIDANTLLVTLYERVYADYAARLKRYDEVLMPAHEGKMQDYRNQMRTYRTRKVIAFILGGVVIIVIETLLGMFLFHQLSQPAANAGLILSIIITLVAMLAAFFGIPAATDMIMEIFEPDHPRSPDLPQLPALPNMASAVSEHKVGIDVDVNVHGSPAVVGSYQAGYQQEGQYRGNRG